jgi:hypothetical protein
MVCPEKLRRDPGMVVDARDRDACPDTSSPIGPAGSIRMSRLSETRAPIV